MYVAIHLHEVGIKSGSNGLHDIANSADKGGWITLAIGGDDVSIHSEDIRATCDQLVSAARQLEQMIADQLEERSLRAIRLRPAVDCVNVRIAE